MISVYLADRQVLFREGIHFTLSGEEDIEVVGETTSNEEALSFIESNSPQVAILNINLGQPSGIELARRIKQDLLSAVSLILVMDNEDEEQLLAAMKGGASACITKNVDPDTLLHIIREVAKGNKPIAKALLQPGLASHVLEEFEAFSLLSQQVNYMLARITPGEADILRRISEGSTGEQMTAALSIDEEALNLHLSAILSKLAANDHSRNLIEAVQRNLSPVAKRPSDKPGVEYITKEEFTAFRDSLRERLGSLFNATLSQQS